MATRRLRALISALLLLSAGLFAVGVFIERGSHRSGAPLRASSSFVLVADADQHEPGASATPRLTRNESPAQKRRETPVHRSTETPAQRSTETTAPRQRETPSQLGRETPAERAHEGNSERVFGINIESIPLVIAMLVTSVGFAVAIWLTDSLLLMAAVVGFVLVAAAFDVREVFHQIDESRTDLSVIAGVVAFLHLAIVAAVTSLVLLTRRPRAALAGSSDRPADGIPVDA